MEVWFPHPHGMSQKTNGIGFSHLRAITQVCLSQKNGCGTVIGAAASLFLRRFIYEE